MPSRSAGGLGNGTDHSTILRKVIDRLKVRLFERKKEEYRKRTIRSKSELPVLGVKE